MGIDPGASGAIVVLGQDNPFIFRLNKATEQDTWNFIGQFIDAPIFAIQEQVGGHIGGQGQPGSAMFNFGETVGQLWMALVAAGIQRERATPQKWQKALGITSRAKTESKTDFKRRLRAKAESLFPSVPMTNDVADALLIAEYCRRKRTGTL
jgi:hypothetical protein